jgi:hypothetical protein
MFKAGRATSHAVAAKQNRRIQRCRLMIHRYAWRIKTTAGILDGM